MTAETTTATVETLATMGVMIGVMTGAAARRRIGVALRTTGQGSTTVMIGVEEITTAARATATAMIVVAVGTIMARREVAVLRLWCLRTTTPCP